LQAYVITADGKSYTAVSGIPKSIGHELQLAEPLGSVIAWLFARPITEAKNGYQLTGMNK
jgi:nidogen (entactin)